MKLYHYSTRSHSELLTRKASGSVNEGGYKKSLEEAEKYSSPGSYHDHISFFFEPIPHESISDCFEEHPFWKRGSQLYEYTVDSYHLPRDMKYQIVETPSLEEFWETNEFNSTKEFLQCLKKERDFQVKSGEIGDRLHKLHSVGKNFTSGILDAYKKSDRDSKKYAAGVPHLMVYSKKGKVPVSGVRLITLGSLFN